MGADECTAVAGGRGGVAGCDGALVIQPLGALEQPGSHLSVITDTASVQVVPLRQRGWFVVMWRVVLPAFWRDYFA